MINDMHCPNITLDTRLVRVKFIKNWSDYKFGQEGELPRWLAERLVKEHFLGIIESPAESPVESAAVAPAAETACVQPEPPRRRKTAQ